MINLTTGIYSYANGSDFMSDIGSRLYKGGAPTGVTYPYAVYLVESITHNRTFTEFYKDVNVKFSLFSIASGTTEIEGIYTDLKTLYDEKFFSITGSTLIWMRRTNAMFSVEDHVTPTGTQVAFSYEVDFEVKTSLN